MVLTGQTLDGIHTTPALEALKTKLPLDLQQLMVNYSIIFEVPTESPPYRSHDHKIPLIDESKTIRIRPYRYPTLQKLS